MAKDEVVQAIRDELSPILKKLGVVLRIGKIIYIRPSVQLGWQSFPKEDQITLYHWLSGNGYTNLRGHPFRENDTLLSGSFYFKIN